MKHLLFVVLENSKETSDIIHEISHHGYNGTIISSTSLHHILEDEKEDALHFISLSHLSPEYLVQNTTIYFLLDDDKVREVQEIIRELTHGFTTTKGGMFTTPIDSYEGSF